MPLLRSRLHRRDYSAPIKWSVRCTTDRSLHPHNEDTMKRSGRFVIVALTCVAPAAAQVGTGTTPSTTGTTPSTQADRTADSAPKAPTYTPAQILGASVPAASDNPIVSGVTQGPSPALPTATSSRTAASAPLVEESPARCAGSAATEAPPSTTQFPGVSASRFQRAGVGAEAFTRPGVSADELRALVPGTVSGPCRATRDVVLYPEPVNQPRATRPTIEQR